MICSSHELCELDQKLAQKYRETLATSAAPDAVKGAQRAWLTKVRNICADVSCLQQAYTKQLAALDALITAANPYLGSFVRVPFILPEIVEALTESGMDDSKAPPRLVMSVDTTDKSAMEKFFGETTVGNSEGLPYVYHLVPDRDDPNGRGPEFGYRPVGRTASGVDVLLTFESGGASMTYNALLLVSLETEQGHPERVLLKRVQQIGLGDRWAGDLKVAGNEIHIGRNRGADSDGQDSPRTIKVTYRR